MMLSRLTFALLLGAGAVSAADTQDPLVAQGAYLSKVGDCAACHTQAAQGDFSERQIRIPR